MKKLLLSLMVFATLASCGKDNKVASAAAPAPATSTSPITTTVAGAAELATKIDNFHNQFGTQPVSYYGNPSTIGALLNSGLPMSFKYTKQTTSTSSGSNNSNCKTYISVLTLCSYGTVSSSASPLTVSKTVVGLSVNVTDKINELKGYINNASPLVAIQTVGSISRIVTRDNKVYFIDTNFPIQAQPTMVQDSTGIEYLIGTTF